MKPIYEPKGKAKEYGDLAINIYTGCPHRCFYCFAPRVLHMDKETFHSHVEPRKGIVEAVQKQIELENITGKLIHLCFTCDPYPDGYDTTPTREIIKLIKQSGNHVQILTKGNGERDFDLLDGGDWYGITYDGNWSYERFLALEIAHRQGIKTWISYEPVLDAARVLKSIECVARNKAVHKIKIGKLNYYSSDINWSAFGKRAEAICKEYGTDYYIKESLRAEMEGKG